MVIVGQSGTPLTVSYTNGLPETYPDWIPVDTRLTPFGEPGAGNDAPARRFRLGRERRQTIQASLGVAFLDGLAQRGFVVGRNVAIEYRRSAAVFPRSGC